MGNKSFTTTFQPIVANQAKNFIDNLTSDPDISFGDGEINDPFGGFVYDLLENLGYDADSASEGSMEVLDIDPQGEITGLYDIYFDDGSDMKIDFKGFVSQKDNFNFIVITEINW